MTGRGGKRQRGSGKYQWGNKKRNNTNGKAARPRHDTDDFQLEFRTGSSKGEPHPGSYAGALRSLLPQDRLQRLTAAEGREEGRKVKRKVALVIGYLGTGLSGMQLNKGARTVEAELELALFQAGLVSAANFGYLQKIGWTR